MNAKKCDRCGKFYDQYSYPITQKGPYYHGNAVTIENVICGNHHYVNSFDLCKDCMDKFEDFLGINKEKESDDEKRNT